MDAEVEDFIYEEKYVIVENVNDKIEKSHSDEEMELNETIPEKINEMGNKSILNESKLQTSVLDDDEHFIYFKLSEQNSKMRLASLTNNEKEKNISLRLNTECTEHITACRIASDGNCLVSSLAHQLFKKKLSSVEHSEYTKKLREEAVEFIKQNMETFEQQIVWREDFDKVAEGDEMQSRIYSFLEKLSEDGFWCGTETLMAISRIYSVNIIIINEAGSCYMVGKFNFDYEKCAIIAYCGYEITDEKTAKKSFFRNHYNSVCNIGQKVMFMCMSKLIQLNKDEEIVISDQSIDENENKLISSSYMN